MPHTKETASRKRTSRVDAPTKPQPILSTNSMPCLYPPHTRDPETMAELMMRIPTEPRLTESILRNARREAGWFGWHVTTHGLFEASWAPE
jgi:hypothetical protein